MPQKHSRTKNHEYKKKGRKRMTRKTPEVTEIESQTSTMEATGGLCDLPLFQSKDPFPWNCLPRELQVKILQNLDRKDLDICVLVNRETFELIRCNDQRLKRRSIDSLIIGQRSFLDVYCRKEEVLQLWVFRDFRRGRYQPIIRSNGPVAGQPHFTSFASFVRYHLRKMLRNASICYLTISSGSLTPASVARAPGGLVPSGCDIISGGQTSLGQNVWPIPLTDKKSQSKTGWNSDDWGSEGLIGYLQMRLTCEFLSTVISCIEATGCRVDVLTIETSTCHQMSAMLLRFFRTIAPAEIRIDQGHRSLINTLTPEVLQFIVTRRRFFITALRPSSIIPVDDAVLAELTATKFCISTPNMITTSGLKSFLQRVIKGELTVTHGVIYTRLHLYDVPFPQFTSTNTVILMKIDYWNDLWNYIEIIPVEEAEAVRRI